jgi:DNA-binding PadR family transcriptional regulator
MFDADHLAVWKLSPQTDKEICFTLTYKPMPDNMALGRSVMGGESMPIPKLQHLQFLVLCALLDGELVGRALREALSAEGSPKSGPAFYQLMARLEDAKFVTGRYEQKIVEGQAIKERTYSLTGAGEAAVEECLEFYRRRDVALNLGLTGA